MQPSGRLLAWDERRFERRFGVDTGGMVEPAALTVPVGEVSEGFTHVATPPRLARWWLGQLPREASSFTFVDMGSGRGRVLLLAASYGFRRAVGVEFAEELHAAALENARAARAHGLVIEPILGDAAAFTFPPEPLVIHFNNPFSEQVMERVLENLNASYELRPRPVIVVYQQLTEEDGAHRTRNLELLDGCAFLSGRRLAPNGIIDRKLFGRHTVAVFESPEVSSLSSTA